MADERELVIYYLRILFSNNGLGERMDEQQENIDEMKKAVELNPCLTSEERNLLSLVYKIPVTSRRNAIRVVRDCIQQEEQQGTRPHRVEKLNEFLELLKEELKNICLDLINLIEKTLLPVSTKPEQRVFYQKMEGDYYRYICENREDSNFTVYSNRAKECYDTALEIGRSEMAKTSPMYLGLVLNFSVFLYEIMQLQNEAIELSDRTFSETIDMIDNMDDSGYSETMMILKLLRDNHFSWKETRDQNEG
jgi:14-3-3 protein epsilon